MKIEVETRSDQINADDLITGTRIYTIKEVVPGKAEQKYDIHLVESPGKCWRPPTTVLRQLTAAWDDDARAWQGRRVELYRDENVSFGNERVGGIRIKALSHIDAPINVRVQIKRGKRATLTVQPLPTPNTPTAPAPLTDADKWEHAIATADSVDQLRNLWGRAKKDDVLNHVFDTGITLTERITQAKNALEQGGQE